MKRKNKNITSSQNQFAMQTATIELNNEQVKALPTTPIQIIAAPGVNKMIHISYAIVEQNSYTGAYTNMHSEQQTGLIYDSTNDLLAANSMLTYGPLVVGPSARITYYSHISFLSRAGAFDGYPFGWSIHKDNVNNKAIYFTMDNLGNGDLTGGDAANTLKVTVFYSIIDL